MDVEEVEPALLCERWDRVRATCDQHRAGLFEAVLRERAETFRSAALITQAMAAARPAGDRRIA
jgi:hypothetical protein